jgi:autotransporter-associated beta strand protein
VGERPGRHLEHHRNWTNAVAPNSVGAQANFFGVINQARTVTVNGAFTIGTMTFNSANSYTIGGSGVSGQGLTVNNNGIATIAALQGAHTITAPLTLGSNLEITASAGATLNFNTALVQSGGERSLLIDGAGTTVLSGSSANVFSGQTMLTAGTLHLNKTAGVDAIGTGGLQINSGTTVQLLASQQIADAASVLANGTFAVGSQLETIAALSGTGQVTLSSGGVLTIGAAANNLSSTFDGVISGTGTIAKSGTGTLTLTGTNTFGGSGQTVAINNGALQISADHNLGHASNSLTFNGGTLALLAPLTTARNLVLSSNGTINVGADNAAFSGVISGAGSLTKSGSGVLTLSGTNTYTGGLTLNGGTTVATSAASLGGSGTIAVNAATLRFSNGFTTGRSFTLGNTLSALEVDPLQTLTITSAIGGAGMLNKTGTGSLVLSGVNTYTGGTIVDAGTVIISHSASFGHTNGAVSLNAATVQVSTGFSTSRSYSVEDDASTFSIDAGQTFTLTSALGGAGSLNKTGLGSMVLSGVSTFAGDTTVAAGILQISGNNRLPTAASLNVTGGTFSLQTFSQTADIVTLAGGAITGSGAGTLNAAAFDLQSGNVSAILAGAGPLTKSTAGAVTLIGANTFTGLTTIAGGILQVNSNNALGTAASGTIVNAGGALRLNGVNYSTAEALTLHGNGGGAGGALMSIGTSTFAGAINAATNATIHAGGGILNLTGGIAKNGTTLTIAGGGTVNVSGSGITGALANSDLVVDGTTLVLNTTNSYNGPTTIQNSGTLQLGAHNVLPTAPQTALAVNSASTFNMAGYSDGVASLAGESNATLRNSATGTISTLTVNPSAGVSSTFAGVIAGTNSGTQGNIGLVKSGAGALTLTGNNTFSGTTTINAGTLTAAAAGSGRALASTSAITVNSGGTLLLGAHNQVNDAAPVALAGGTIARGNFSEGSTSSAGFGALTLSASGSRLDFGTGTAGVLAFAGFTANNFTLTIDNWSGTANTLGSSLTDRLIFSSSQSANLGSFSFTGYAGATQFDLGSGYFEVVPMTPVPEPSTYAAGLLAFMAVGWQQRRRLAAMRDKLRGRATNGV